MIRSIRTKLIAVVLVVCTMVSFAHIIFNADSGAVRQRMDAFMSSVYGKSLGGADYTYYKNGYGIATGCHAFVNALWHSAFGYDTYDSVCYTTQKNYRFSGIADYLKNNASVGDILRFGTASGARKYTHSMVIKEIGENGITTYEFGGPRHYFSEGPLSEYYSYSYLANYYGNGGGYYFLYKSSVASSLTYADTHPAAVHVHSYSIATETAHPHREYRQCECGDWAYTGQTADVAECTVCHPPVLEEQEELFVTKYEWSKEGTSLAYDKWLCKVVSNNNCDKLELYVDAQTKLPIEDKKITDKSVLKESLKEVSQSVSSETVLSGGNPKELAACLPETSTNIPCSELLSLTK